MYGLAVKADVKVNGAEFTSLGNGETYSAAIPAGTTILAVTCTCGAGERTLRAELKAGQQYRFAVNPLLDRDFDWGALGTGALWAGLAGPIGGAAAQSAYYSTHQRLPPFDIVAAP